MRPAFPRQVGIERGVRAVAWQGQVTVRPAFVDASPVAPAPDDATEPCDPLAPVVDERAVLEQQLAELFARAEIEGRAQGEAAGQAAVFEQVEQLGQLVTQLATARQTVVAVLASQATTLALAVARVIVGRELAADASYCDRLVREVLSLLPDRDVVRVRVAPASFEGLADQVEALKQHGRIGNLSIEPDPSIGAGCIVETPKSFVDARVEERLRNVARSLQSGVIDEP